MKIRIHPALYGYLISMLVLSSWETCVGGTAALLIHELGHYVVSLLIHESIELLELTPFGGVMIYQQGKSPCKGIRGFCLAAAGPAANYLLLMYADSIAAYFNIELMHSVVCSCIAMIFVNMLPALPLDGGRMIFCLGYYIVPLTILIAFLTLMGIIAGIGFLVLAVYGFISKGILNCSLLIAGGYLMYSAWKSREQLLIENLFVVIQEAGDLKTGVQQIKTYHVSSDTPLIRLLPYLNTSNICEFACESDGCEHRLSERQICRLLLDQPLLSIGEVILN